MHVSKSRENAEPNRIRDPYHKRLSPHTKVKAKSSNQQVPNEMEIESKIRMEVWNQCNERIRQMEDELKNFQCGFDIQVQSDPAPATQDIQKRIADLKIQYEKAMKRNKDLKGQHETQSLETSQLRRDLEKACTAHSTELGSQTQLSTDVEAAIRENTELAIAVRAQREERSLVMLIAARRESLEYLSSSLDSSELSSCEQVVPAPKATPRKKKGKKRGAKKQKQKKQVEEKVEEFATVQVVEPDEPCEFATTRCCSDA